MKHLKGYKLFESNEEDITDTFSSIIYDPKIVTIPHTSTNKTRSYEYGNKFNIYVLYGDKVESDHNLLKELYYYRDTIRNLYNIDYFFISLIKNKVIIILKDYKDKDNYHYEHDLKYLATDILDKSTFLGQLPREILNIIMDNVSSNGRELRSGIHKEGESSNMALFDWIYEK